MPTRTRKYRGGSGKNWSRHASAEGTAGKQVVCFFEGPLANNEQKNLLKQLYDSRSNMSMNTNSPDVVIAPSQPKPALKLDLGVTTPGEHLNTAVSSVQMAANQSVDNITSQASDIADNLTSQFNKGISTFTDTANNLTKNLTDTISNLSSTATDALQKAAATTGLNPKVRAVETAASSGDSSKMREAAEKANLAANQTMKLASSPRQEPSAAVEGLTGGRRKRRRTKRKIKRRKYKRGTKSKTHSGKDFETRKKSKRYRRKSFKKRFGRETIGAPLFPFVGGRKRRGGRRTRRR